MPPFDPPDLFDATAKRQRLGAAAVLLAALLVGFLPENVQRTTASLVRATVLKPFLVMQESLVRERLRRSEVAELQARLDSLQVELVARTTLEDENRRLRGLLELRPALTGTYRAAVAIRPGTPGAESMFLLDVGAEAGVRPHAPVLTREGLAGVVREVRAETAIGVDWTHPDFRPSAMAVDGLTFGFVESRRAEFREGDRLLLAGTPFSTDLEPGTLIVTSGLGGVFPRGIPIGRVDELAEAEGGWRKSYWLVPFVDVGSLAHVLVAIGPGEVRPDDESAAFPPGEVGTAAERIERQRVRADSLARLTEEVVRLRARLDSLGRPPVGEEAGG